MCFVRDCAGGEVELGEIHDYIDAWHNEYLGEKPLHEYLGLTLEEYSRFVRDEDALKDIIEAYKIQ